MSEEKKQDQVKNVKSEGVNIKSSSILEYIKVSEITQQHLEKMETCIVSLKDTFDKKKNAHRYSLTFKFKNGMEVNKYITKNEHMIVTLKRKLHNNIPTHSFLTPCRFVKGNFDTDGDDYWIRVDIFIAGGYTVSEFLNGNDKYCVKVLGNELGYTLVESPEVFNQETIEIERDVFSISE